MVLATDDLKQSRPADILVNNWGINGKPAAFDLSVSSPLKPDIVSEAGHTAGSDLQLVPQNSERYKQIQGSVKN